jgi:hypothetical protein
MARKRKTEAAETPVAAAPAAATDTPAEAVPVLPRYRSTWVNRTADLTAHLNEIAATGYRLVSAFACQAQVPTDQGVRWAEGIRMMWEATGR